MRQTYFVTKFKAENMTNEEIKNNMYPGPWRVEKHEGKLRDLISIVQERHGNGVGDPDEHTSSVAGIHGKKCKRKDANAELMCQAANLVAEAGLTPMELLKEQEKLRRQYDQLYRSYDNQVTTIKRYQNQSTAKQVYEAAHEIIYSMLQGYEGMSHFNAIQNATKRLEAAGVKVEGIDV